MRRFITLTALTAGAMATLLAGNSEAQSGLRSVRIATGFSRPLFALSPPGDTARVFIVEQRGEIYIIKNGTTLAAPFLDVGASGLGLLGSNGNEQGLLGMAFHPDYASNGKFYLNYTDSGNDTVIEEYTVSGNPDLADTTSGNIIFGPYFQPQSNHNGGCIQFSPVDGMLYCGMGDGGGSFDSGPGHAPGGNAQSDTTLLGKMIRLDVDSPGSPVPYLPPDNPFIGGDPLDDFAWSYGQRNPFRFSFDRATGDMYVGDVGQFTWEEISHEPAGMGGRNYGWRCMEGLSCTGQTGCVCNAPALTLPVKDYLSSGGPCTVIGGYVYNGCAMPDYVGTYFYADYCQFNIWSFELVGGVVTNEVDRTLELTPTVGTINSIASFGEDALGELLICDLDGDIFRIRPDDFLDCNTNSFPDGCDIALGTSQDCNDNGIPDECETLISSYCTAGTSASGCSAVLNASGLPSVSASSGFTIDVDTMEGSKDGLFFYGFNGSQGNAWGSGNSFQCVVPPVIRTPLITGTGNSGVCDGAFSLDLNAYWSTANPSKVPGAGQVVDLQLWYRDPLNTSNQTTSLSDGLEFTVCP